MAVSPSFAYNSTEYWLKKYPKRYLFNRVLGVFYVLGGLFYFSPWGWGHTSFYDFFAALCIVVGLLETISPLWISKLSHYQLVTISDGNLKWKEGIFHRTHVLSFDEIISYKIYIGQIHFTTTDDNIVKLNHYIIEDETMQREFIDILKEHFSTMDTVVVAL